MSSHITSPDYCWWLIQYEKRSYVTEERYSKKQIQRELVGYHGEGPYTLVPIYDEKQRKMYQGVVGHQQHDFENIFAVSATTVSACVQVSALPIMSPPVLGHSNVPGPVIYQVANLRDEDA